MAEAQRLAREGKPADGVALVERAANSGDTEALLALANWRLWGLYGPREPAATHRYLERAAQAGSQEAAKLRAILIGNGTGCEADPATARRLMQQLAAADAQAADQLALLDQMPAEPAYDAETLSSNPLIRLLSRFMSDEECDYLVRAAQPLMRPSMIIDPASGRRVPHPFRTSTSMNFDPTQEDLVVHALNRRIAVATGTLVEAGEPLHILRYTPGQEFRPHHDAIEGAVNQRQWTALVYLNDQYEGGETVFPEIGLTVGARRGDCLVFENASNLGEPNPKARHAGLPVTDGTKWLASRWIRQRPYTAEVARG